MTKQTQTLAKFSPPQLERFIVELANLKDEPEAIERFQRRFADLIPIARPDKWMAMVTDARPAPSETYLRALWILLSRKMLRGVLMEQDLRRKEWRGFSFFRWVYSFDRGSVWGEG